MATGQSALARRVAFWADDGQPCQRPETARHKLEAVRVGGHKAFVCAVAVAVLEAEAAVGCR